MSLNMEKNNDNPTKKESNHGKTDLLDNFALLKTYVSLLENTIQTSKHSQLQSVDKSLSQLYNNEIATFHDKSDVDMNLFHDFYELTGIRCVKLERKSSFVFEMCSNKTDREDNYMVEILIDDHGRALLGDNELPAPVNVEEILSKYPIDDVNNVTHFLNSCKHYVETYVCREEQFTDLKNLLSEIIDAEVYHDYEFTLITITIPGIMDINPEQIYKVALDLYYKSDEIRPYKLSSACKGASSRFLKRLNKFFKPFLRESLCSALLQINISNTETNLFWQKIMINDDSVESYEVESSNELFRGIFKPYLYRKNKKY